MRKTIAILVCCLLLAGCSGRQGEEATLAVTTEPVFFTPGTSPVEYYLTLYAPNEDATGFIYASVEVPDLSAESICKALIGAKVLNADVAFNSLTVENGQVELDVNQAFLTQLCSYGTTGEYMMTGSVVNTLLSAYGAETVFITCEGSIMESGHVIYDFPMEFHKNDPVQVLACIGQASPADLTFDQVEMVDIPSPRAEELGITPENTPGTFFLHNETVLAETFPISPDCICTIFDWYDDYLQKTVTVSEFAELFIQRNAPNIPYYVTIEDNMVIGIEELLVP